MSITIPRRLIRILLLLDQDAKSSSRGKTCGRPSRDALAQQALAALAELVPSALERHGETKFRLLPLITLDRCAGDGAHEYWLEQKRSRVLSAERCIVHGGCDVLWTAEYLARGRRSVCATIGKLCNVLHRLACDDGLRAQLVTGSIPL
jgi:hypothetical protein